jgi:predicted alpha-1,6-mannanase (GH76 family)
MRLSKLKSALAPLLCLAVLLLSNAKPASSLQPAQPPETSFSSNSERAALAVQSLQTWYNLDTGLYKTTGWWNAANVITTLADYAQVAPSRSYDYVFSNSFYLAQKTYPGFINKFYDDEGWWALAWIKAYQGTHDMRYLDAAKSIFTDMTYGWDDTCSGGIWWSKDRKYKNAIANELFLSVAAQLTNESKDPHERATYLSWATREWHWFSHSGMINEQHLVNDGLTAHCENNKKNTWTYNQGVILGGLVALHQANHDPSLLPQAHQIAAAALSGLTDGQKILHDTCEPNCGGDGTQFKGIFVRNLMALYQVDARPQYRSFVQINADSIWTQTTPANYHLGEVWTSPFGTPNASTQSSALDTLVAAVQMSKKSR